MEWAGCSIYFALFCLEQNNLGPVDCGRSGRIRILFTELLQLRLSGCDKLEEGGIGIFGFAFLAIF